MLNTGMLGDEMTHLTKGNQIQKNGEIFSSFRSHFLSIRFSAIELMLQRVLCLNRKTGLMKEFSQAS